MAGIAFRIRPCNNSGMNKALPLLAAFLISQAPALAEPDPSIILTIHQAQPEQGKQSWAERHPRIMKTLLVAEHIVSAAGSVFQLMSYVLPRHS